MFFLRFKYIIKKWLVDSDYFTYIRYYNMKKFHDIDFKSRASAGNRSVRKRVALALLAALIAGAVLFTVLLGLNDFDISKFLGARAGEETNTQPGGNEAVSVPADALFSDTAAKNILVILSEEKNVTLSALLSFSVRENSVKVKPIAGDVKLSYAGREGTLEDLFSDFGAIGVKTALEEKYGLTVVRYLSITEANFKNLFQILGSTPVYFERAAVFSVDAIKYSFVRGTWELTPDALLAVIKYAYEGEDGLRFGGQVLADILKAHLTPENFQKGEAFFSGLVNYVSGNITAFDYADYKDAVEAFLLSLPEITVIS